MRELTINQEIADLIPALSQDELAQLRESIKEEGCRDPIIVWANHDDTILDGHNRYAICTEEKIEFKTKALAFEDLNAAKNWAARNQLGRRNLTPESRRLVIGRIYISAKNADETRYQNDTEANGRLREKVAEETKSSPATVVRAVEYAEDMKAIKDSVGKEVTRAIESRDVKSTTKDVKALAEAPKPVQKKAAERIKSGEAKSVKEAMGKKPRKKKPAQGTPKANFQEVRTYIGRTGTKIDDLARVKPGDKWARRIHANITDSIKALDEWRACK